MSTLRATEIFSDSRVTLIAVESVDFRYSKTDDSCRLFGKLAPVAVIVCGADGSYALDMEAKPAALAQLRQDIPELEDIMQ